MSTFREILNALSSMFRWWYVVAPWEQSIRVRWGKHVRVLGAGVHLRVPIMDAVYVQSTRRRFVTLHTMTLTTTDDKTVTVSGEMAYEIADIGLLYQTLHDATDTIESAGRGAMARHISDHRLEECKPQVLVEAVRDHVALERYGLANVEVFVTDFAVVRTYRLIQGEPKNWTNGEYLDTNQQAQAPS